MARKFEDIGFERVDYKEEADVYVVNSCSVTAESDRKSRNMIRTALKRNPNAVMMVTGCYAQLKSDEVSEISGVDYVLGSGEKLNILRAKPIFMWLKVGKKMTIFPFWAIQI